MSRQLVRMRMPKDGKGGVAAGRRFYECDADGIITVLADHVGELEMLGCTRLESAPSAPAPSKDADA